MTFYKIRCQECKNEQIIFGKASEVVRCLVCEETLATPTGGKTNVDAQVLEILE